VERLAGLAGLILAPFAAAPAVERCDPTSSRNARREIGGHLRPKLFQRFVEAIEIVRLPNGHAAEETGRTGALKAKRAVRLALLQILPDASISGTSSLESGKSCMIMSFSQIAFPRPKPMPDASVAL